MDPGAPALGALLVPFDCWTPTRGQSRLRRAASAAFTRVLAQAHASWPGTFVPEAAGLPIELLPFQLAPALAMLSGAASRVLIADEVGLGKTIQAGLVLRGLAARGLADRVLVLVPAGLRAQWQEELTRLQLGPRIVDRVALRERAMRLPPGVSAWHAPGLHVMSIEFARQIDVLSDLAAPCWDVLVIDEAHHVAGSSARAAAARTLARRARHVLLLTATPHGGDPRAFVSLCTLGRLTTDDRDPMLWFRRTRGVRGMVPSRRSAAKRIRESDAERRMIRLLDAYASEVEAGGTPLARLAMLVLRKRALSSPAALAASLHHRRACLAGVAAPVQPLLPLDPEMEIDACWAPALSAPGPQPISHECARLDQLVTAAARASAATSKLACLVRLLSRCDEPLIVFTEYRDTLDAIVAGLPTGTTVAVLHGGVDPDTRREALSRFTRGEARVLAATDAAGEGLNLQEACRLVVHYELPWSPSRLEQRVGRVDRLGQRRRVHVWHLLGRHGHERRVLRRLAERATSIRRSLGGGLLTLAPELAGPPGPEPLEPTLGPGLVRAGFDAEADGEAQTLELIRRLLTGRPAESRTPRRTRVPVVWLRPRARELSPGVAVLFAAPPGGPAGREDLVPVHVALGTSAASVRPHLAFLIELARERLRRPADGNDRLPARLLARERALLSRVNASARREWQPALFDRRAERAAAAAQEARDAARREHQDRLMLLGTPADADAPARPLAVLVLE